MLPRIISIIVEAPSASENTVANGNGEKRKKKKTKEKKYQCVVDQVSMEDGSVVFNHRFVRMKKNKSTGSN